jgi:glycosyltransferase 2 family protein
MVAIYTSMGVPTGLSVVVILGYRLFSFWLPSIIGFGVIEYLKRAAR